MSFYSNFLSIMGGNDIQAKSPVSIVRVRKSPGTVEVPRLPFWQRVKDSNPMQNWIYPLRL